MPKLGPIKQRDFDRKMRKLGAVEIKGGGKGSHRKFKMPDGRIIESPGGRKDIRAGTQRSIVRQLGKTMSYWKSLVFVLVGLAIGVPIMLIIFSDSGPFSDLVALPSEGTLQTNPYSGILLAGIGIIPLAVVGVYATKFTNFDLRKIFRPKKRRRRKR